MGIRWAQDVIRTPGVAAGSIPSRVTNSNLLISNDRNLDPKQ
jgi:hypothetical protein